MQAGLRLNPEFDVEFENFAGGAANGGTNALETALALSQVIELGDKRNLRRAVAEADLGLISIKQRGQEPDLLAEVTRRFSIPLVARRTARHAIRMGDCG